MADETDDTTANALKARRRSGKPRAVPDPEPVNEPAIEPAPVTTGETGMPAPMTHSTGISSHSLGGPSTLTGSFVTEGVSNAVAGEYIVPDKPGYVCYYPRGAKQPTTILVWNRHQQVRRDHYALYGGDDCASTPGAAKAVNEVADGIVVPH